MFSCSQTYYIISLILCTYISFEKQIRAIQLNGFHPKHVFKLLKGSKGTKKLTTLKFSTFKAELLEKDMFDVFQFVFRSEFKNLIEESLFNEVRYCS